MAKDRLRCPELGTRKLACENSRFLVFMDRLVAGSETLVEDYLVVSPRRTDRNLVTGVGILPIFQGKIGLLKAYRHPIRGYSWEIPRGFVSGGESVVSAALRELEEETGLRCERWAVRSLGFITPDAGILAARIQLFVARRCVPGKPYIRAELGHREFGLFESSELGRMVLSSQVQDSYTIVAYHRYKRYENG